MVLSSSQILTGITIISNNYFLIFASKNENEKDSTFITLTYVVMFSSFLGFFGLMKFGRRTLLLIGYFIIALCLLGAGILQLRGGASLFFKQGLIVIFLLAFGLSSGHQLVYLSEIMQPKAISFVMATNWLLNLVAYLVSPPIISWLSSFEGADKNIGWLLIFLSIFCLLSFIYLYNFMIETSGLSATQIA